MAFCHNCGVKLPENAKFCQSCGTPVLQQQPQAKPPQQTARQPGQAPYGYRPKQPPQAPARGTAAPTQAAPKKKGKLGLRLAALLLAVALGITGFWQPGFVLNALRDEAPGRPGSSAEFGRLAGAAQRGGTGRRPGARPVHGGAGRPEAGQQQAHRRGATGGLPRHRRGGRL